MTKRGKTYAKLAFSVSVLLLLIWAFLGTGTTLAWFRDTTPVHKNSFVIGDLDVTVSYRTEGGSYLPVTPDTPVFDDEALYEPGYVQTVILKVENTGTVPFDYKLSVDINSVTLSQSVLGNEIYLPNYLRYGVLYAATESEVTSDLTRQLAELASPEEFPENPVNYPFNMYAQPDSVTVPAGGERYLAIIVRMPQDVGNAANYRGNNPPSVSLGITVLASQEGTLK